MDSVQIHCDNGLEDARSFIRLAFGLGVTRGNPTDNCGLAPRSEGKAPDEFAAMIFHPFATSRSFRPMPVSFLANPELPGAMARAQRADFFETDGSLRHYDRDLPRSPGPREGSFVAPLTVDASMLNLTIGLLVGTRNVCGAFAALNRVYW